MDYLLLHIIVYVYKASDNTMSTYLSHKELNWRISGDQQNQKSNTELQYLSAGRLLHVDM